MKTAWTALACMAALTGCASTPYYSAYLPQDPQGYVVGSCDRNMCSLPTPVYGAFPPSPPSPEKKAMDKYLDNAFSIANPLQPTSVANPKFQKHRQ